MPQRRAILLTGATGLLGQYLLRDMLVKGGPVAVLARDAGRTPAAERIAQIITVWSERLGRQLPTPVVLNGDLCETALGLTGAERRWVERHCRACSRRVSAAARALPLPQRAANWVR